MKKIVWWSIGVFLVYGACIWAYLFYISDTSIPQSLKGTSVDPATFMNGRELMLTEKYSKIRDALFFIRIPYEWLGFILILVLGMSRKVNNWSKDISRFSLLQTAIYVFWLSVLLLIYSFPMDWISYKL